jgi:hypothetical protein
MFSNYRSYYNKEPEQRRIQIVLSAQDVLYRALPNLYPELSVLTLYPISVNA